jgi:hypothetical protein
MRSVVFLAALAACRPAAPTSLPPVATPAETATAAASPTPWILVGDQTTTAVQTVLTSWADAQGLELRVESLAGQPATPPDGAAAVVGLESELLPLLPAWSQAGVVFEVIDPSALVAGAHTSTLGPTVAYDQAGFLAGVAAGLATRTGLVGLLPVAGSDSAVDFRAGFEEGLLYSCPKCQLETVSNPGQAAFGMDVVGIPPDSDLGPKAPGVSDLWLVVFGDAPLGSWAERVGARVRTAPEAVAGPALGRLWEGQPGEAWVFSAANGGLVTEVDPQAVSPGRERLLREAEASLAEGWLVVGGGG